MTEAKNTVALNTVYNPKEVEEKWYDYWESHKCFSSEHNKEGKPFSIVMPPPNVTGQLHMGHALDNTMQDILTRWKRMQGYHTLWIPGTDHAGIATQAKVEAHLAKDGVKNSSKMSGNGKMNTMAESPNSCGSWVLPVIGTRNGLR